jgi:lysozyme family protein
MMPIPRLRLLADCSLRRAWVALAACGSTESFRSRMAVNGGGRMMATRDDPAMDLRALEPALRFVLRWEGGFVDHPDDPGGRTNRGVTQKVYDGWRARQGLPGRDVKLIGDDEVHAIYASDYWLPPRCDALNAPLDVVQFDTAVNMGVGRAVRFLQASAGCDVDGQFGAATELAVARCDGAAVLAAYCQRREDFYRGLAQKNPKLSVFLKGWMNRLNALRAEVGVPGFAATRSALDFGDAAYIARVPDFGEDPTLDD